MIDATKYTIVIKKVEIENETYFEAKVKELPDIAEYADNFQEAYDLTIDSIETTAKVLEEKGVTMPSPLSGIEDYSGRITLRIHKSLHRFLDETSEVEGVSLNQHIVNILNYHAGIYSGSRQTTIAEPSPIHEDAIIPIRHSHLRLVNKTDRPLAQAANGYWR